jgi:hypothetical protein
MSHANVGVAAASVIDQQGCPLEARTAICATVPARRFLAILLS